MVGNEYKHHRACCFCCKGPFEGRLGIHFRSCEQILAKQGAGNMFPHVPADPSQTGDLPPGSLGPCILICVPLGFRVGV